MTNLGMDANLTGAGAPARAPRYVVDFQIAVTGPNLASPLRGQAFDISVEGMGATLVGQLPLEQEVTITCVLPMVHEALRVRARVSHRDAYRHGFEFLGLEAEELDAIRRMSERLHAVV